MAGKVGFLSGNCDFKPLYALAFLLMICIGSRHSYAQSSQSLPLEESDTLKTHIDLIYDPFWAHEQWFMTTDFMTDLEKINWIKFTIFLDDLTRVYFQDTRNHKLHYAYATTYLEPFLNVSATEYDRLTLDSATQIAVIGTVLYDPDTGEYGIELAGLDPYPRETVRDLLELVDSSIDKPESARGFYFPTLEQKAIAQQEAAYFELHSLPVSSIQRWLEGENVYAQGWGIGRLRWIPSEYIDLAFQCGDLTHDDILFTDVVPAELPYLQGIISLSPATPNSHVAILAGHYGVPFIYVPDSNMVDALYAAVDHEILLRVVDPIDQYDYREWIKITYTSDLDATLKTELQQLKQAPALDLPEKESLGRTSIEVDSLTPADINTAGGKAAHFGFLRRVIPDHSPTPALAFTFDLWDDFQQQILPTGETLAQAIEARLGHYVYPAEIAALSHDLAEVRDLITDSADFSTAQRSEILEALSVFDSERRIRFRSSTNVEDTDVFVGAGLYDSYSGCLQDDLDNDDRGPCHCDPNQDKERGALRAIKKVYASFYNDNAFIERLRHQVDESTVGMAILAHYSFPDETELANGVATASFSCEGDRRHLEVSMVTQQGATSVTNPSGDAIAEVVELESNWSSSETRTTLRMTQRSNLLQPGQENVLSWEEEYRAFNQMFCDLADAYHAYYPDKTAFTLDFEYKKTDPNELIIKQIRELPVSTPVETAPVLLKDSVQLQVSQGYRASAFAHHRLKSLWSLETDSRWLDANGLASSCFTQTEWTHTLQGSTETITGNLASWNEARHGVLTEKGSSIWSQDSWVQDTAYGRITLTLEFEIPSESIVDICPIFWLSDLNIRLRADYPEPQPVFSNWQDRFTETDSDLVYLEPLPEDTSSLSFESKSYDVNSSLQFDIGYCIKPIEWPIGMTGYTPTVWCFDQTTINGLVPETAVTLSSYWSQTCKTYHKPYFGDFIFEPQLDPGVSPEIRQTLEHQNIRLIFLHPNRTWEEPQVFMIGFDGTVNDYESD